MQDWIDNLFEEKDIIPYVAYLIEKTNYDRDRKDDMIERLYSGDLNRSELIELIPILRMNESTAADWSSPNQTMISKHIRKISQ